LSQPLVGLVEGFEGNVAVEEPVAPHLEATPLDKLWIVQPVLLQPESTFAKAAVETWFSSGFERGRVLAGQSIDQPGNQFNKFVELSSDAFSS